MDRLRDQNPDVAQSLQSNIFNKFQTTMSPEVYSKIKGKRKEPVGDLKSNDNFALGQTMLSLYTNSTLAEIYKPNGDFDHTKE